MTEAEPREDPRHATSACLDPNTFGEGQACFGCSQDHPTGLRLRFTREGDWVTTRFSPGEGHQGPPGIMHGGLVATLADEVAAWAIIGVLGKFGFTARMSAKLLKPVRIGAEVFGRSRVAKNSGRTVSVEVLLVQSGEDVYKGEFTFVLVDRTGAERLLGGPLQAGWERFLR
jgi:acyl-coenzyme A thioesterase PaaI-like protein